MRTLYDVIEHFHKDLDPLALFTRRFAMSIMAIRIHNLGWELHCSAYDFRLLLLLAEQTDIHERAIGIVAMARIKAQMEGNKEAADIISELLGMKALVGGDHAEAV